MDGKKIENLLESKSTVAGKGQLSLGVTRCHKSDFSGKLRRRDNVPPK